jgi:lysozyme family protein
VTREEIIGKTIDDILAREGGYVNHSADPGGVTNFGITIGTLSGWRRQRVTPEEVKALSELEARQIYRSFYIERPGFLQILSDAVFAVVVDTAVNFGPAKATAFLQLALGVAADGILGPKTRAALDKADGGTVYRKIVAERIRYRGRRITAEPSQAVFAKGWLARDAEFVERAV